MTLNQRRQSLGLTHQAVANATGLSLRTVIRLMSDNSAPASECSRKAFASALRVDLTGLAALVAAKPAKRGALTSVIGRSASRRAHAPSSTVRGSK